MLHNRNPQASNGVLSPDTRRDDGRASGSVTLHDADGDTVRVDSVISALPDSRPGVWDVDDQGARSLVVSGEHGTLYLHIVAALIPRRARFTPDGSYAAIFHIAAHERDV